MYIDAFHDTKKNRIRVVERVDGERIYNEYPAVYRLYYPDNNGHYESIHGYKLAKIETNDYSKFRKEQKRFGDLTLHENDIKPTFRCLEEHYRGLDLPKMHTSGLDIEVDFCKKRGYATTDDPHQPVTSITFSLDWLDKLITLVVPPKTFDYDGGFEAAANICDRFDDTYIFDNEKDMLIMFLELIDDVDVLYTWNGEGFDIPYLVNRIMLILDKDYTKKLCLFDQFPSKRTYQMFGKEQTTYDLIGRIHLDYMALYKTYTYHEMHSYSLNSVAEYELGEKKTEYEGTLDDLYNNDFELFLKYNRQDVNILRKLDDKLRFLELTNMLAHENCVLLPTTLGSVQLVDQAITLFAHDRNQMVPSGSFSSKDMKIAGAYVADPVQGLHEWVGSIDINSLYPSTIRMLNMSPETVVGQIRLTRTETAFKNHVAKCKPQEVSAFWHGKFGVEEFELVQAKSDEIMTVDFDVDGSSIEMSGKEIHDMVFESDSLCISANGTIFRTDQGGVIPDVLSFWYADRKKLQKTSKDYDKQSESTDDNTKQSEYKELSILYDKRQHVKKILLNSLYGVITSPWSRFSDQRVGQSTTLSGRQITKHMISKTNELLGGDYDHEGPSIVYGDTDSVAADSKIRTIQGDSTIEELFLKGNVFWKEGDKEYSRNDDILIAHSGNTPADKASFVKYNYVYRHKVKNKPRFRIKTQNGKEVTVTDDHSIMVLDKSGNLVEKKPSEIIKGDKVITLK